MSLVSKDAWVLELAGHIRELFVLRPEPRARLRQEILRRMEDDRKVWKTAARRLRRADPKLAALGIDLLDKIATAKPPLKPLPKKLLQSATAGTGKKMPLWIIWSAVVCGVLVGFLKDDKHSPLKPTAPTIRFPHDPFPPQQLKKISPEVWHKANEIRPLTKEELKKRIEEELRLMFSLSDGAAWAKDPEGIRLLAACGAEIDHYEHLASSLSYSFDRLDLLLEAVAGWRKLVRRDGVLRTVWRLAETPINNLFAAFRRRRVPAPLLHLIRASWARPFAEVREPLMNLLEEMANSPQQWLKHLDVMQERAPATLALFGELLDRFEENREGGVERHNRDVPTDLVRVFLSQLNVFNYEKQRQRLLRFCIHEGIAPEEMAEAASVTWNQALTADWPLRYVCRACRLFWV